MKKTYSCSRRQLLHWLGGAAALPMLSSCGTILYPDRAYQKKRGALDPAIVILDGIGLFFFVIPGLVAFAIDFTTGAIYFPADHEPGDRERTIFDQYDTEGKPDEQEIERVLTRKTGQRVNLANRDVRTVRIDSLDQFWTAYARLSGNAMLAKL